MNWRPSAQLVRLPNLPTALADITLAALAVSALPGSWLTFLILLLASAALYMSGMAFNDYFDRDEDQRERPERPIPSGAVSPRLALLLATALMVCGVLLGTLAGLVNVSVWSPIIAVILAVAILAYDGGMKRTVLGPVVMGSCRFLNVLLGTTIAGAPSLLAVHLATIVGLYIVGVTWFARTEARTSSRSALMGASAVMLAALLLALPLPEHLAEGRNPSPLFVYLLVGLGFFVGLAVWQAIDDPAPGRVQAGVKRALMGLILLDTVLATGTAGTIGLVILIFMVPSVYLNRQRSLYAT